jgi:chromosome segregation ATPase
VRFPPRGSFIAVAAILMGLSIPIVARADAGSDIRQELASLKIEIERLDAALAEGGQKRAELREAAAAYATRLEAVNASGRKVREWGQHLTARKEHLVFEHEAASALCRRPVSEQDYKAKVAECKQAIAAYQRNADELQQEHEKLADEYARYDAAHKELKTEQDKVQQLGDVVQAREASLHAERETAVKRFNEAREKLIALQSKSN